MHVESPAMQRLPAAPISSDELAEGLMLVRASTLKMIRLQLAMERNDRRVAIEAVDDLVALDRRLQHYLADATASHEQLMFRRELDAERAMLNREKLTLGAEVIRKAPELAAEPSASADDDWLGPRDFPVEAEEPRRRRWWLAAVVPAVAAGVAASAYVLLPEVQMWAAQAASALR